MTVANPRRTRVLETAVAGMKYRGDISPEEYGAMEDGYEQGVTETEARFAAGLQETLRAARAEAWEEGHKSLCRRHGSMPFAACRNPYRTVPSGG